MLNIGLLMGLVSTLTQAAGNPAVAEEAKDFVRELNQSFERQRRIERMLDDILLRLELTSQSSLRTGFSCGPSNTASRGELTLLARDSADGGD